MLQRSRNINPDLDYGIAPMVKGKTEATVLGGWTWNINTNCKDPELAYDLIQYLNSEKGDSLLGVKERFQHVKTSTMTKHWKEMTN